MTRNGYITTICGVTVWQFKDAMDQLGDQLGVSMDGFGHTVAIVGDGWDRMDWEPVRHHYHSWAKTRQEARHTTCVMEVGE